MYLTRPRSYFRGNEQCVERAPFLLLLQPDQKTIGETCCGENTYAVVRKVALRQCGHWMMGRARVGAEWKTISGSYGSDGLPMGVKSLPKDAVKLPPDLYEAWRKGDGWNSAGAEAPAMREWARKTFKVKA